MIAFLFFNNLQFRFMLSLQIVTGVNVHLITPIVCIVCIFYTCVGGLKAVVWTDVVQLVLMFAAIGLIIIKGTLDVGGYEYVWNKALESGRIEGPEYVMNLHTKQRNQALKHIYES